MSLITKSDMTVGGNLVFSGEVTKAPTDLARIITANGEAVVYIETKIAIVSMSATIDGATYKGVYEQLKSETNAVISKLQSLTEVMEVTTRNYRIYPRYSYNPYKFEGYTGYYGLEYRTEIVSSGDVMEAVSELSTSYVVNSVNFIPLEADKNEAQNRALAEATENAVETVNAALSKTEYKMSEVYDIQIISGNVTKNEEIAMADASAARNTLMIVGGEARVSSTVRVKCLFS